MTWILDKLVVSIAGVESRSVAFQWVEVGGRGGWGGGGVVSGVSSGADAQAARVRAAVRMRGMSFFMGTSFF